MYRTNWNVTATFPIPLFRFAGLPVDTEMFMCISFLATVSVGKKQQKKMRYDTLTKCVKGTFDVGVDDARFLFHSFENPIELALGQSRVPIDLSCAVPAINTSYSSKVCFPDIATSRSVALVKTAIEASRSGDFLVLLQSSQSPGCVLNTFCLNSSDGAPIALPALSPYSWRGVCDTPCGYDAEVLVPRTCGAVIYTQFLVSYPRYNSNTSFRITQSSHTSNGNCSSAVELPVVNAIVSAGQFPERTLSWDSNQTAPIFPVYTPSSLPSQWFRFCVSASGVNVRVIVNANVRALLALSCSSCGTTLENTTSCTLVSKSIFDGDALPGVISSSLLLVNLTVGASVHLMVVDIMPRTFRVAILSIPPPNPASFCPTAPITALSLCNSSQVSFNVTITSPIPSTTDQYGHERWPIYVGVSCNATNTLFRVKSQFVNVFPYCGARTVMQSNNGVYDCTSSRDPVIVIYVSPFWIYGDPFNMSTALKQANATVSVCQENAKQTQNAPITSVTFNCVAPTVVAPLTMSTTLATSTWSTTSFPVTAPPSTNAPDDEESCDGSGDGNQSAGGHTVVIALSVLSGCIVAICICVSVVKFVIPRWRRNKLVAEQYFMDVVSVDNESDLDEPIVDNDDFDDDFDHLDRDNNVVM
jgi:hypothetical protein